MTTATRLTAREILEQRECNRPRCDCHAATRKGTGLTHCPNHNDPGPSLSVKQDGDRLLLHCFGGCERAAVSAALGIAPRPAYTAPVKVRSHPASGSGQGPVVARYAYTAIETGQPIRKLRHEPKDFSWESQDAAGNWKPGRHGLKPGLYHQDEIANASPGSIVFFAGGEKSVEALRQRGELATCAPDGDNSFDIAMAEPLRDKVVIVVPDHDDSGTKLALRLSTDLAGIARHIYLVELPGLTEKQDVYDYLQAGGTVEQIVRLALCAGHQSTAGTFDNVQSSIQPADLERSRQRLSRTLAVQRNKNLGPIRHTAVQLINEVAAAIDRGDVDADGAGRVSLLKIAGTVGLSRGQFGKHTARIEEWGFIDKRLGRSMTSTDAGDNWNTATFIKLTDTPEETLRRLATYQPAEQKTIRPVKRCPVCGSTAEVRRRWENYCGGCDHTIDSGDDLVAAADPEPLMFTKATSETPAALCPLIGTNTSPFSTSAPSPDLRGLMVPKAPSEPLPDNRICPDCGGWLNPVRFGEWACNGAGGCGFMTGWAVRDEMADYAVAGGG